MAVLIVVCIFVLLGVVVLVVGAPLRDAAARRAAGEGPTRDGDGAGAGDGGEGAARRSAAAREELEVSREAKYREIRDAELDYRTGKLSESDYRELDAELRAEALAILDALEEAGVTPTGASGERSRSRRTRRRRRPSSD